MMLVRLRVCRWTIWIALGALTLVTPTSAEDRVLNNDALAAAMDVYVDSVIAERAVELACNPPGGRDQWTAGNRQLIATLWANGLPDKLVRDLEHRLAAPAAAGGSKPDCNDPEITAMTNQIAKTGWPAFHKQTVESIGLAAVTLVPTDEQFAAVKAVFAHEAPAEARMLSCLAVTQGVVFPFALSDWTATVVEAGKMMVLAGLPRDEVVKLIDTVDPAKIWKKASGTGADDLKKSCAADRAWSARLYQFETRGLRYGVEKILKPTP